MRGKLPQQRGPDSLPPGLRQHPRREEAPIRRVHVRVPAADELAVVLGDDVEPTRIAFAPLALLLDVDASPGVTVFQSSTYAWRSASD